MHSAPVAFVTGGGRGIGRAIALALADAGHAVAIAARTIEEIEQVAREIEARGQRTVALPCDVTSGTSVSEALTRARQALGPLDVLVNNAGFVESAPLLKLSEEVWTRTLDVNLTGTYLCTRAALPAMIERRHGRIVNIASIAGRVGFLYTAAYCAAKHGVIGFTRAVALEVALSGITVNAICPGWVNTEMTTASIARIAEKTGRSSDDARAALEGMSPQRRLIEPHEVAALAVFLAGDAARGITGQAIDIDGGEVMA